MSDCFALAGGYPQGLNFNINNLSQKTPNFLGHPVITFIVDFIMEPIFHFLRFFRAQ